ncbi:MAG TPA: DNA replication/repair protein RecF [Chloroflexota bacterium]
MYLKHLTLVNFRNYVRLGLEFDPAITILLGDNAQGKTNLLEAVHILATGKSLRAGSERELVHWLAMREPAPSARLEASVVKQGGETHVEMLLRCETVENDEGAPTLSLTKTIRVNGLPRRVVDFIGEVNVVLFTPDDVNLVQGAPAGRRRYLDVLLAQVDHRYLRSLQRYQRVLLQRNHLLRQVRDGKQRADLLEFWDRELVASGGLLLARRASAVARLGELAGLLFRDLAGGHSWLSVAYRCSVDDEEANGLAAPHDEESYQRRFAKRLQRVRSREVAQGVSLVGPHRDDLTLLVDDVDVGTYGSRGQQRLVALALKMAELEFLREETGEPPILLLDDVLSELDAARRSFVLSALGASQTMITTTDLAPFEPSFRERARIYRVQAGRVLVAP